MEDQALRLGQRSGQRLVLERKAAKLLGLRKYWTGRVCRNGHRSERYTSSGVCVDCIRDHQERAAAGKREAEQALRRGQLSKERAQELGSVIYCQGEELGCGHMAAQWVIDDSCTLCHPEYAKKVLDLLS